MAIHDAAGDLPIRAIKLSRDPLTKLSWGVCHLEMNSVLDSMHLFRKFEDNPPIVDGKTVSELILNVLIVGPEALRKRSGPEAF